MIQKCLVRYSNFNPFLKKNIFSSSKYLKSCIAENFLDFNLNFNEDYLDKSILRLKFVLILTRIYSNSFSNTLPKKEKITVAWNQYCRESSHLVYCQRFYKKRDKNELPVLLYSLYYPAQLCKHQLFLEEQRLV